MCYRKCYFYKFLIRIVDFPKKCLQRIFSLMIRRRSAILNVFKYTYDHCTLKIYVLFLLQIFTKCSSEYQRLLTKEQTRAIVRLHFTFQTRNRSNLKTVPKSGIATHLKSLRLERQGHVDIVQVFADYTQLHSSLSQ
jgi:hypothetical protein